MQFHEMDPRPESGTVLLGKLSIFEPLSTGCVFLAVEGYDDALELTDEHFDAVITACPNLLEPLAPAVPIYVVFAESGFSLKSGDALTADELLQLPVEPDDEQA